MNLFNPTIEVESNTGTREVSLETRHLMNRALFINGEIDADMANDFLQKFMYLEQSSRDPVTLYINSPGGEVPAGLMIYDILMNSKLPITTICTGLAASMAAILLAGGQKGRRYIFRHAKVLIHEPRILSEVGGSASSIRNISESILSTRDEISEILAEHTARPVEEINRALKYDHYFDAFEAINFGLADDVIFYNTIMGKESYNGKNNGKTETKKYDTRRGCYDPGKRPDRKPRYA